MSETNNSKRNRILLGVLALVALFYFGERGYKKLFEEPAKKSAALKSQLKKKLKSADRELKQSLRVVDQLETLEQQSLPWDAEMARARYQAWLLQLAKDAKL